MSPLSAAMRRSAWSSAAEPMAMERKFAKSRELDRMAPSAMFAGTLVAARVI